MCVHLLDSSVYNVRHDILSVHVQISYGLCERPRLQIESIAGKKLYTV
jgi:hypothetical protein